MNIAEAIALSAVVIGLVSGAGIWLDAYKRRLTNRERELEMQVQLAAARETADQSEVGQLEARLRVLERIATDRKQVLADEIEALRDERTPA